MQLQFGLQAAINCLTCAVPRALRRDGSVSEAVTMADRSDSARDDASSSETRTNTILLDGLLAPDNHAIWQEFVDRYRPMIVRYGLRFGLSAADAEDVAQQALASFCTAYQQGKYDRQKGRLRHWLFGIARNSIANWSRRGRARELQLAGDGEQTDFFAAIADPHEMERLWEQEWRASVLQQCLDEIRDEVEPHTFEAFHLFAAQGLSAEQVAEQLGMTANAVFSAKRRILRRVRELLPKWEDAW